MRLPVLLAVAASTAVAAGSSVVFNPEEDPYADEIERARSFEFPRISAATAAARRSDDYDESVMLASASSSSDAFVPLLLSEQDVARPLFVASPLATGNLANNEVEREDGEEGGSALEAVADIIAAEGGGQREVVRRKLRRLERTNPFLTKKLRDLAKSLHSGGDGDQEPNRVTTGGDVVRDKNGNELREKKTPLAKRRHSLLLAAPPSDRWRPVLPGSEHYYYLRRKKDLAAVPEEEGEEGGESVVKLQVVARVDDRRGTVSYRPDFRDAYPTDKPGETRPDPSSSSSRAPRPARPAPPPPRNHPFKHNPFAVEFRPQTTAVPEVLFRPLGDEDVGLPPAKWHFEDVKESMRSKATGNNDIDGGNWRVKGRYGDKKRVKKQTDIDQLYAPPPPPPSRPTASTAASPPPLSSSLVRSSPSSSATTATSPAPSSTYGAPKAEPVTYDSSIPVAPKDEPVVPYDSSTYSAPKAEPVTYDSSTYGAPKAEPVTYDSSTYGAPKAEPVNFDSSTYGAPKAEPVVTHDSSTYGTPKKVEPVQTYYGPTPEYLSGKSTPVLRQPDPPAKPTDAYGVPEAPPLVTRVPASGTPAAPLDSPPTSSPPPSPPLQYPQNIQLGTLFWEDVNDPSREYHHGKREGSGFFLSNEVGDHQVRKNVLFFSKAKSNDGYLIGSSNDADDKGNSVGNDIFDVSASGQSAPSEVSVTSPTMPHIPSDGFPSVVRHLSASSRSMPFHHQRVGPQLPPGGLIFDGRRRPPVRAEDVVADYGAAAGGGGAFGWYSEHPVLIV